MQSSYVSSKLLVQVAVSKKNNPRTLESLPGIWGLKIEFFMCWQSEANLRHKGTMRCWYLEVSLQLVMHEPQRLGTRSLGKRLVCAGFGKVHLDSGNWTVSASQKCHLKLIFITTSSIYVSSVSSTNLTNRLHQSTLDFKVS